MKYKRVIMSLAIASMVLLQIPASAASLIALNNDVTKVEFAPKPNLDGKKYAGGFDRNQKNDQKEDPRYKKSVKKVDTNKRMDKVHKHDSVRRHDPVHRHDSVRRHDPVRRHDSVRRHDPIHRPHSVPRPIPRPHPRPPYIPNNRPVYSYVDMGEMYLNNQFYVGKAYKSNIPKDGIVAIRHFTLHQPSVVTLYATAEGYDSRITHRVYNQYDEPLGKKTSVSSGGNDDNTYILPAGEYTIKSEFYSIRTSGYLDYRIRGTVQEIPVNMNEDSINRTYNAPVILFNQEVCNILSDKPNTADTQQYYKFNHRGGVLNLHIENFVEGKKAIFKILDAYENPVTRTISTNASGGSFTKNESFNLAPGTYYIKVERGMSDSAAFRFKLY